MYGQRYGRVNSYRYMLDMCSLYTCALTVLLRENIFILWFVLYNFERVTSHVTLSFTLSNIIYDVRHFLCQRNYYQLLVFHFSSI